MDASQQNDAATGEFPTDVERISDREIVVTRRFNAPARLVFQAWTTPALLMRWWAPKSFCVTFISAEVDARSGGSYRFVMGHPSSDAPMAFFGRYREVVPGVRLVWTNEEDGDAGSVTTVTFEEQDGTTLVTVRDLYASKQALDDAMASGSTSGWPEQFAQLDAELPTMG